MQSPKKSKTTLTIELSSVILTRLREVAKQNGRTVAAEIRFAIKRNNRSPITLDDEELAEMSANNTRWKGVEPIDYPQPVVSKQKEESK